MSVSKNLAKGSNGYPKNIIKCEIFNPAISLLCFFPSFSQQPNGALTKLISTYRYEDSRIPAVEYSERSVCNLLKAIPANKNLQISKLYCDFPLIMRIENTERERFLVLKSQGFKGKEYANGPQ